MDKTPYIEKLLFFFSDFHGATAYVAILGVLLICGLGVPMPEDITLLAAGLLAAWGNISLWGAFVVGFIGVMLGDCILFFLGRKLGRRVFDLPGFRRVFTPERINLAEEKIRRNSRFVCFSARFLPGVRSAVFLTSGMLGISPWIFLALDGLAALISVPVWILVGWWFGLNFDLDYMLRVTKGIQTSILIGVVVLFVGYFIYKRRKRVPTQPQSPQV